VSGWYPKHTDDGRYLVTGAGELFVNGESLNVTGWQPTPFDGAWIVYNGGPGAGTVALNLDTGESEQVYPLELIELAGGGGTWAGRDASRNAVIVSDGRVIENAGQPSISALGVLTYRTGDDRIEPSICRSALAWGDGRGRVLAEQFNVRGVTDVTVGPAEHRPVLLDTPEGAFVFCMAGTSLHLRPLFGSDGYEPPDVLTGNDRNINAHAVYADPRVLMAWQDTSGNLLEWSVLLTDPRKPLGSVAPPPSTPTPEPDVMDMPLNAWRVIEAMHAKFAHTFPQDENGARSFTEMVIQQLVFSDPLGGWCWKRASEGRPASKDCTARQIDGRFEGWDILSAAGHNGPRVLASYPPPYHDLIAEGPQVPITVGPVNHLGAPLPQPPEPQPPVPQPPVPPTDGDVIARLIRIEAILTRHFK
jgi:hypothetical protein